MKISTVNIHGNAQIADIIINNSKILDDTDKKFVELIHENTSSEYERKKLIESLEILKLPQKGEEEKEASKSLLKKFLEEGISEAGKEVAKGLLSSGFWSLILG